MSEAFYSVIAATGKYIPTRVVKNEEFLKRKFYNASGSQLVKPNMNGG